MKCPFCSHLETQVVETRVSEDGYSSAVADSAALAKSGSPRTERPEVNLPAIVKRWQAH